MKTSSEIIAIAKRVIRDESESTLSLISKVNNDFAEVVHFVLSITGRVVITGIGKSAIIAQKIVATLNSTGTPSVFMHAADAVHGDLGIIKQDDLVICISKSGNTPEIKFVTPLLKNRGNKLVAIVGDIESYLAKQADWVLNTTVVVEACPNNLAPTSSTTAQLVMGDALAVSLLECRAFGEEDFAKFHPGGALGKRLYLRAEDLAVQHQKPFVHPSSSIKDVLLEITNKRLGVVAVLDGEEKLLGVITDGDIRRMLEQHSTIQHLTASDIMNCYPKTIQKDELAISALQLLRNYNINQLIVMEKNHYFGVVHLHDLLKEGIV